MFRRMIVPVVKNMMATPYKGAAPSVASLRQASDYAQNAPTTTMDDLPIPSGSWESHYQAKQTKYNMHLALGVAFLAVTIVVAKASGLVYLNYSPPPYPEDDD